MDHNLSSRSNSFETTTPKMSLFKGPGQTITNDNMAFIFSSYIAAAALVVYALVYIVVLLFKHSPRQAFPSEHTFITNNTDGSISDPQPLHFTSEYLTENELRASPTLFRPKSANTLSSEKSDSKQVSAKSLHESNKIELSVIVPCYNETKRLHLFLEDAVPVLESLYPISNNSSAGSSSSSSTSPVTSISSTAQHSGTSETDNSNPRWEILLVDDGSVDGTAEYAIKWAADQHKAGKFYMPPGTLRVCKLEKNRGKGGAVTHGMLHVRGKCAIFADADGASKFDDVRRLLKSIKDYALESDSKKDNFFEHPAVAIGSRAHMVKTDAVVKRSFIRNFLMYGLHALVYIFGIRTIGDTQCGFKMYTRTAILQIFPYMHTEGWIFDVETLIIAMRANIPVMEVPISWHEVEGSKVELAKDSIKMAIDLVVTRIAYFLGVYTDGMKQTKKAKQMAEAGQSVKME